MENDWILIIIIIIMRRDCEFEREKRNYKRKDRRKNVVI